MSTLDMPAGRELDAIIAERVMGLCPHPFETWYYEGPDGDRTLNCGVCHKAPRTPSYSTGLDAAWKVIEKVRERYPLFGIHATDSDWVATFAHPYYLGHTAPTPSLAICRAALAAMEAVEHAGRDG